jgi:hypothetical protein
MTRLQVSGGAEPDVRWCQATMASREWTSRRGSRTHTCTPAEPITFLWGSCNIQLVKVAVGVQGGWIEATICDQAPRPTALP